MVAVLSLAGFGLSTQAALPTYYNHYHWTNATGDSYLQTAANWQEGVVPTYVDATETKEGDRPCLVFPEGTGVVTNQTESYQVGRLFFEGSSPITFAGKKVYPTGNGDFWTNQCPVVFDADYKASAWSMGRYVVENSIDFKKSFEIVGSLYCTFWMRKEISGGVHFRGPFTISTASMEYGKNGLRFSVGYSSNSVYFHDAVNMTSNTLFQSESGQGANIYFYGPINGISLRVQSYRFNLENANILSPTGRIDWAGARAYGIVDMNGHDQVVGSLDGTYLDGGTAPAAGERVITSETPATLTVRCAPSATTPVSVQGQVNLVINAATPDGAQTFEYRDNTTVGTIVISNGTLRLAKGAKFSKVMSLHICANGRLEVDADNGVAQPFPALLRLTTEPGASVSFGSGAFPAGIDATQASSYSTAAADTVWAEASGDWATATGWSAGVPTLSRTAAIIGSASGQTVTLTTPADGAKGLLVASPIGMSAKLAVTSTLPLADATVTLKGASELEVGNGGEVVNAGVAETAKEDSTVAQGARLTVKSGGAFKMQDSSGNFVIGGEGSGKLTVEEGGLFEFDPGKLKSSFIGKGNAELDIRGTLAVNRRFEDSNNANFDFTGDRVRISGDGKYLSQGAVQRSSGALVGGASTYFHVDNLELSDRAMIATDKGLNWRSRLQFSGKTAGSSATLTFKDDASISNTFFSASFVATANGSLYVDMSEVTRGFSATTMENGLANVGYTMNIGSGNGRTVFDYGGIGFSVGAYNFSVGATSGTSGTSASDPGYAELNLMNGAVVSDGGSCAISRGDIGATRLSSFYGTTIGSWNSPKSGVVNRIQKGRMTLRDAGTRFSVSAGHFIVGLGRGHGQYVQMDGATTLGTATGWAVANKDTWLPEPEQVSYKIYATNSVFMLGVYGGLGECIVSNGAFRSNLRTFVGGITTNQYFDGAYISLGNALNLTDAEGYLRIVGGSYTNENEMFVGSCGTGTVEVGPRGSLTASTVVLSNQTASVLSFRLDAANGYRSGESSAKKLVVTDGASLKVDLGDYRGKSRTLLKYAAKEGDFLPAKIELTGENVKDYSVEVRADRIFLKANIGTVILFR